LYKRAKDECCCGLLACVWREGEEGKEGTKKEGEEGKGTGSLKKRGGKSA
jgi:hypothetical protein